MTKEEHELIVKELEAKWLGKKTPEDTEIIDVFVDFRKEYQFMNRVEDEDGNVWFLDELESEEQTHE